MATNPRWAKDPKTGQWIDLNQYQSPNPNMNLPPWAPNGDFRDTRVPGERDPIGDFRDTRVPGEDGRPVPGPWNGGGGDFRDTRPPGDSGIDPTIRPIPNRSGMISLGNNNYTIKGNSGYRDTRVPSDTGFPPGVDPPIRPVPETPPEGSIETQELLRRMQQPGYFDQKGPVKNNDPIIGDFRDTRVPGENGREIPSYRDTRVPGESGRPIDRTNPKQDPLIGDFRDTRVPGESGREIPSYKDTRVPGEDGREIPSFRDTRVPGEGVPQFSAPSVMPFSDNGISGLYESSGGGGRRTNLPEPETPTPPPVTPPTPPPVAPPPVTPPPPPVVPPRVPGTPGTGPWNGGGGDFRDTRVPGDTGNPGVPGTPTPGGTGGIGAQVVPGAPKTSNQMNIADFAGQVVTDPSLLLRRDDPNTPQNESMFMSDQVKKINAGAAGTNINANDPRFAQQGGVNTNVSQGNAMGAGQVDPRDAHTYDAQTAQANVTANGQANAATGQVNDKAVINAPQIDMKGTGTGVNADGSTNYTGQALKEYAEQDLEAVNKKATVKGQLEQLTADFIDKDGNPKIPAYAQGQAREVSRIAAFKGMTGTAATAAMSQALLEASITVATQDASFYHTLTLQNLSNKQASTINRANVLAKMDQVNVDNRMAAAIQNSKSFMDMDMKNLDNEQQAQVINSQARIQAILEDAKAINASRLFNADSKNETDRFYDQLNTNIAQFNASQQNAMTQFNSSEANDMSQFDVNLNNQREQFYKEMQYNIDTSNAKWRQTVTLQDSQNQFDAAALDVKNLVGISTEQLNQLWDRSDALLDYLWKSTENQQDRNLALALEKFKAGAAKDAADSEGWGSIWGTIGGTLLGKLF